MCRTGCKTRDHSSYSECLKAGAPGVLYANSAKGHDYGTEKKWQRDLDAYRDARSQGIQPASTRRDAVDAALRASDSTGTPFRADA